MNPTSTKKMETPRPAFLWDSTIINLARELGKMIEEREDIGKKKITDNSSTDASRVPAENSKEVPLD